MVPGARRGHAVGDHAHPLGRQPAADVEIAHAAAVDHDAIAMPGDVAIHGQLGPTLPGINAALAGNDAADAARAGRRKAVGIGGEHPGMDQVRPQPGNVARAGKMPGDRPASACRSQ